MGFTMRNKGHKNGMIYLLGVTLNYQSMVFVRSCCLGEEDEAACCDSCHWWLSVWETSQVSWVHDGNARWPPLQFWHSGSTLAIFTTVRWPFFLVDTQTVWPSCFPFLLWLICCLNSEFLLYVQTLLLRSIFITSKSLAIVALELVLAIVHDSICIKKVKATLCITSVCWYWSMCVCWYWSVCMCLCVCVCMCVCVFMHLFGNQQLWPFVPM